MAAYLTISEAARALLTKSSQEVGGGWSEPEIYYYLNDVAELDYKDVTWNYQQDVDGYRGVVAHLHSVARVARDLFDDCVARRIDVTVCRENAPILMSTRGELLEKEARAREKLQVAQDRFNREFPKTDFSTISAYDISQAYRLNAQAQRYGNAPAFLDQMRSALQEALRVKEAAATKMSRK